MNTTTTDATEVQALFTRFLDGWNAGSGEAFLAPFTDTISFIGFDGTYFTDKSRCAAFHQTLFDKWLKGSRLIGEPTVRFTTPDSAVIVAHGGTILRGKTKPSRRSRDAYMLHRHLLQHEDLGMMGQFLVLDNGQRPGTPSGHRHHN